MDTQGTDQTRLTPAVLGVNAATVATGVPVTSNAIDTRKRSQLTLSLKVVRHAATAWAVYFEYSPDYWDWAPSARSANAQWIRVQASAAGVITAGAVTVTLGDATWSFTTSTNDTIHIDLPTNAPAYRFVVDNTAGDTDTAKAWVTLGNP